MSVIFRWGFVIAICYGVLVSMGGLIGSFMGYTFSEASMNVALTSAFLAYMPASLILGGFLYALLVEEKLVRPVMYAVSGEQRYNIGLDDATDHPFSIFRAICAGCSFMLLPTAFVDISNLIAGGINTLPVGFIFFGSITTLLAVEIAGRICMRILRVEVAD
jgi:hypothetical protein